MSGDEFTAKCEAAALELDALAGCHAVTSDEGTSYCPLAEANAAAVARDAKVAEIVAGMTAPSDGWWQVNRYIAIADLYPETGK